MNTNSDKGIVTWEMIKEFYKFYPEIPQDGQIKGDGYFGNLGFIYINKYPICPNMVLYMYENFDSLKLPTHTNKKTEKILLYLL